MKRRPILRTIIGFCGAAFLFLSWSGLVLAAQPGAPKPAPKTETTTQKNPDGTTITTTTNTFPDGSKATTVINRLPGGYSTTTYTFRDGSTTEIRKDPSGREDTITTRKNPDDSTTTTATFSNGTTTTIHTFPDGSETSTTIEKGPGDDTLTITSRKDPDGTITTAYAFTRNGSTKTTTITTRTNPDGSQTQTVTYPDGSTTQKTIFLDGSWIERDRDGKIHFHDPPTDYPPKTVGERPATPTNIFVAVDNRPQTNVCVEPGQDAARMGGTVIASGPAGTIIRAPGDPKSVEKKAQEMGLSTCFAESDFCTIMTPLTPFRGHDHEAHEHSGRGLHEHDAPDPPLDWGVNPPETLIRWE